MSSSVDGSVASGRVLDPWGDRVTPQALAFVDDPAQPPVLGQTGAEYRRDVVRVWLPSLDAAVVVLR
jgi:hypothetical protein